MRGNRTVNLLVRRYHETAPATLGHARLADRETEGRSGERELSISSPEFIAYDGQEECEGRLRGRQCRPAYARRTHGSRLWLAKDDNEFGHMAAWVCCI